MATDLPRPRIGACIRVLPSLTRTFLDPGRPAEPDPNAGEQGIVIGYEHRVPVLNRRTGAIEEGTWDLEIVFFGGHGSVYDVDEIEILYDTPWEPSEDAVPTGDDRRRSPSHGASDMVWLPVWVYKLITAIDEYEDVHAKGWHCFDAALGLVPLAQLDRARAIAYSTRTSGETP